MELKHKMAWVDPHQDGVATKGVVTAALRTPMKKKMVHGSLWRSETQRAVQGDAPGRGGPGSGTNWGEMWCLR